MRALVVQATRFGVVGVLNSAVGLATILACQEALGLPAAVANVIGYAVGLAMSFLVNRTWTFEHSGGDRAIGRFLLAFALAYLANIATVLTLIRAQLVSPAIAQVAGVIPYTTVFFLLSRYFVFVERRTSCDRR